MWTAPRATLSGAAALLAALALPASAQQAYLEHEGYVCATAAGIRAIAEEMVKDDEHDTVWTVVNAVRGQGHDCTHTRGPLRAKVVRHVDAIEVGDVPMHIVEVRPSRARPDVFILTVLE